MTLLGAIDKIWKTLDDKQKHEFLDMIKGPASEIISEVPKPCEHALGVSPATDGGISWFTEDLEGYNPSIDCRFDFCPFCGKDLTKEE